MKLSLLALLSVGVFVSLGATSSGQEMSEQELAVIQEEENKKLGFQMQLEEIENERLDLERIKEQEAIVEAKAVEIAEKAEAERLAEEKRLAEEERLAEEKRLAEESAKQAAQQKVSQSTQQVAKTTGNTSSPAVKTATKTSSPAPTATPAPAPVVNQTSGFNFNGHHFPLGSFSGGGRVPQETNRVYQWTDKPDHFLVERISPAGRVITGVGIGTKVVINGTSYTVTNMERNIPNNAAAVDYLYKHNAAITFQTCETTMGANGKSHVRFWYAR